MRTESARRRAGTFLLSGLWLASLAGCPVTSDDFVAISEHGFDRADHQQDLNDYPWAMEYFVPDGSQVGHLYVGTGNSIAAVGTAVLGFEPRVDPPSRPPEIRRYRSDLGPKTWQRVLDYRDVEASPDWETSGFRGMAVYRARTDGVSYLYAGTFGLEPALWRSPAGDPGTWERVWSNPHEGSVRVLAAHDGLLYIGVSHESQQTQLPGELYATDGAEIWLVNGDGFGNPENTGVFSLASFNGWLYAGTNNRQQGYQVWKLAGPEGGGPLQVVAGGGPSRSNQATTKMVVFQEHLYVPALILAGINIGGGFPFRGADMIRIDANDNLQAVVGPRSVGGVGSGFSDRANPYLWSLVEHDGKLYCGTWDATSLISLLVAYLPELKMALGLPFKPRPGLFDFVTSNGAELYVSSDGVHWETVFTDGLGNPDNYGVRNMVSAGGTLYLGMANIFEGLEIWRLREAGP